jgi:uncharacterized membrane protein YeaQ/YmgE (transglycosylase-associated protein family)
MELLSWVLFGFVVGLIARALMPGRDPLGLVATVVLGIVGALFGGWAGQFLGFYTAGANVGILGATLGAVVVLAVYNAIARRQAQQKRLGARALEKTDEKKGDRAA